MGREAKTEVRSRTLSGEARVHLDSDVLAIGPPFRLKLPLSGLGARAGADGLTVTMGEETYRIAMSEREAAAWSRSILNPPSLSDKLGLTRSPGVALIGALPGEIVAAAAGARVYRSVPKALAEGLVIVAALSLDTKPLAALSGALPPRGAAWLVYEKGVLKGDALILSARAARLKDTKVARISKTHAALRFIAR